MRPPSTPTAGLARTVRPGRAAILALALAAACAPPDRSEPDRSAPDGTEPGRIDWERRSISLEVGDWTLDFCEGEGPFLCVSRDGRHAGAIELMRWPIDRSDPVGRVLASGGDVRAALEAAAADLTATVAADRRIGCGPDYEVVGVESAPITSGGAPGLRSGFRGRVDGRVVERMVHYRFVARDTLFVLAAAAYEPGGCLAPEGEFSVSDLESLEPLLDRVARASRFGAR